METNWRLTPGSKLTWHSWGSEHLVFNENSGATHLLPLEATKALQSLAAEPQTITQLHDAILETSDKSMPHPSTEWLEELLKQFQQLGLSQLVSE